jgi:magnesium transporter
MRCPCILRNHVTGIASPCYLYPMALQRMKSQLLYPEFVQAIETGDPEALEALREQLTVEDLAELVDALESPARAAFLAKTPATEAAEIFQHLDLNVQRETLEELSSSRVAGILNEMDADDRTALLESLPLQQTKRMMSFLRPRERAEAQKLLEFPEDSVGRLMTPDFLAIRREWTVGRALDFIRFNGEDKETLNDIYVVDRDGRLLDDIPIREFLLSPSDRAIAEVMDGHYTALRALDPQETAISGFKKYSARTALPVVDEDGLLLGIVTIDDILHLQERETTEDIQKFGGAAPLDEAYLDVPIWSLLKKRGVWLIVLFFGQMLTASAMSFYEVELASAVVLALFIPLIISSGGNSGSQAATLVIRALALGEVVFADLWKVLWRELVVGVGLGLVLGVLGLLRVVVWGTAFQAYGEHFWNLGLSVGVAVICVVAWGNVVGSMLPLALKRMGLDPATSSAPFVATFIDVTGILIYFNIAMLVMSGRLF